MKLPPLNVPDLLRQYGLKPDKRLGQNFLVDPVALERIVEAAKIRGQDAVLEIGPGLGALTRYLAESAKKVVAVEIDADLIAPLRDILSAYSNVTLIQGDILELRPEELMEQGGYLVVANIPYYITSAVIRHLLEAPVKPRRMVLTVQREVAQRICADPGDLSLLALSVQVYGNPRIAARIPAGSFYPAPKVDSAVVEIDLYPEPKIPADRIDTFFRLAKAGFSQKRKTLRNSLSAGMHLSPAEAEEILLEADIEPRRRAQALSMEAWRRLVELFSHNIP
ncbi:MAG TPA: 16S rRNA (adenine(1518)-N(6)/adenine(1519)-N(6))-dimethyltransferase RsmA [Anaerolineales bacterium]